MIVIFPNGQQRSDAFWTQIQRRGRDRKNAVKMLASDIAQYARGFELRHARALIQCCRRQLAKLCNDKASDAFRTVHTLFRSVGFVRL